MQLLAFHRHTKYLFIISGPCNDISILVASKYNIFKQLQSLIQAYRVRISIIVVVGRRPNLPFVKHSKVKVAAEVRINFTRSAGTIAPIQVPNQQVPAARMTKPCCAIS